MTEESAAARTPEQRVHDFQTAVKNRAWVQAGWYLYELIAHNPKWARLFPALPSARQEEKQRHTLSEQAHEWFERLGVPRGDRPLIRRQMLTAQQDLAQMNAYLREARLRIATNPL